MSGNIQKAGKKTIGLLGTRFTMRMPFLKDGLSPAGITTLIPDEPDLTVVDQIIFNELGKGILKETSKRKYLEIIKKLESRGAEGIVLGCTEIPLLIGQEDCDMPLFNTSTIHAEKALQVALK